MAAFLESIESAFIIFPIIAFIFTIPYMIYQYRKYGAIPAYRSIIIYSFLLYLLCSYFLVILPLPSKSFVLQMKTPHYNLIPFHFISQIKSNTSFYVGDFATYFPTLKNPIVYEAIFNIILLIPFGCYLKYYFNYSFKKTTFYSFCYSLFFELTQLTGLYFIYPRSYRVFDVDDLLLNTFGGIIGYGFGVLLEKILPTREKINQMAFKDSQTISIPKRFVVAASDLCIFALSYAVVMISLKFFLEWGPISAIVLLICLFAIYYIIVPVCFHHATIAMHFFHVELCSTKKVNIFRLISYYYFRGFVYFFFPITLTGGALILYKESIITIIVLKYLLIIIFTICFTMYMSIFLKRILNKRTLPEKLSKISIKSNYPKVDK